MQENPSLHNSLLAMQDMASLIPAPDLLSAVFIQSIGSDLISVKIKSRSSLANFFYKGLNSIPSLNSTSQVSRIK